MSMPRTATAFEGRSGNLVARRRAFGEIDEATWDALVAATAAATPFSRYCVQKAWWDAYGSTAHDQTLVIVDESGNGGEGGGRIAGIAPLMHRHELEPGDLEARTTIRHEANRPLRPVPDSATAVFFGASYHADYATILAAPADLAGVCDAVADQIAAQGPDRWDVVDLRRLRAGDRAADELAAAFKRRCDQPAPAATPELGGLTVTREVEEVCPIVTLPEGGDFEEFLGTLGKKERHEIRRKLRRAEGAGEIVLESAKGSDEDVEAFIDLHQKRWGAEGLFPPTAGGAASRRFFEGLLGECARTGIVDLSFLSVGGRRIAAGVTMDDGENVYYYNAGVEPEARELSPGVVMVACYVQRAIALGRRRLDFLRGNESYKYEWGAIDSPIERLLVRRTASCPEEP
jgi:CelD/BcsL family acetyltransferase involved in cellulose biosynthesis